MKTKNIYIFASIICLCFLCLCSMTITTFADSPSATLTIDGKLYGTYETVQEALNLIESADGSNFVIEIAGGTVSDPLNILQRENKNVVIRPQPGESVIFTDTITIDVSGRLSGPETVLIQGLTFDFTSEDAPGKCIFFDFLPVRDGYCYLYNITINGCDFTGIFNKTVAVQSVRGGSRNIAVINCTATDMHSLAKLKAVSGYALIKNCTVGNSGGGVNFYGVGDLIVDNCRFDVVGYAVRSGGSGSISDTGSVTINNSILNSNSSKDGTIVLRGDSTNNINILHSNITNENPDGAAIRNINEDSHDKYDIDVVESNITSQIIGIDLPTITVIDNPNVTNGHVSVIDNPGGTLILLITILDIILVILLIILAILIVRIVIGLIRFFDRLIKRKS